MSSRFLLQDSVYGNSSVVSTVNNSKPLFYSLHIRRAWIYPHFTSPRKTINLLRFASWDFSSSSFLCMLSSASAFLCSFSVMIAWKTVVIAIRSSASCFVDSVVSSPWWWTTGFVHLWRKINSIKLIANQASLSRCMTITSLTFPLYTASKRERKQGLLDIDLGCDVWDKCVSRVRLREFVNLTL